MLKTAITENKTQFADDLRDQLTQHASDVWEQFKQDNKLTDLPWTVQPNIVTTIVDYELDSNTDDLLSFAEDSDGSADDIPEIVTEFLNETAIDDDLFSDIEKFLDTDTELDAIRDEIVVNLENDATFSQAYDGYWRDVVVRNVSDLTDAQYVKADGALPFVEKYAPDWEESGLSED